MNEKGNRVVSYISQGFRRAHWSLGVFLVLIAMFLTTGCEPLRKKFIREKKKDPAVSQFVPVFEPEVYPVPKESLAEQYDQLYVMWIIWSKEFLKDLSEQASTKRLKSSLEKMQESLLGMDKLLAGGAAKTELAQCRQRLDVVYEQVKEPAPLRNDTIVRRQIVGLEKDLRTHLKSAKVIDQFLKAK
jgi:hypothetical protein